MDFRICETDAGMTVGAFLKHRLSLSSKMIKYLKYREDGILQNGARVTVRRVLQTGDLLSLAMCDSTDQPLLEPVDLPLPILFEDADIVVPNKPANMPTHPSHDHHRDTVANALAFRYRKLGIPFVFRPVNRLDRDTSGLLLIARNKLAAGRLTASMQAGEIRKTHLAVLLGDGLPTAGRIEHPLHRTKESIILREICSPDAPDAEPAVTEYRVLARAEGCALVAARPLTGRTHQLRVHFASLGCPILSDDLYGSTDSRIARQALHAYTLVFPHPATKETMTLTAPLPDDFAALVSSIFPNFEIPQTLF